MILRKGLIPAWIMIFLLFFVVTAKGETVSLREDFVIPPDRDDGWWYGDTILFDQSYNGREGLMHITGGEFEPDPMTRSAWLSYRKFLNIDTVRAEVLCPESSPEDMHLGVEIHVDMGLRRWGGMGLMLRGGRLFAWMGTDLVTYLDREITTAPNGQWHTLEINTDGAVVNFKLNGQLVLTADYPFNRTYKRLAEIQAFVPVEGENDPTDIDAYADYIEIEGKIAPLGDYEFDENSADITNPWLAIGKGEELWHFGSFNGYSLGVEEVYGIKCQKICGDSRYNTYSWIAQDAKGNVHLLKWQSGRHSVTIAGDFALPNYIMPADPQVGDHWFLFGEFSQVTVESITAAFQDYSNCLELKRELGDQDIYRTYYGRNLGLVGAVDFGGDLLFERFLNTAYQEPYDPAILVDSNFAFGHRYPDGFNIGHAVAVIDHDGASDDGGSHVVMVRAPDGTKWNLPFDGKYRSNPNIINYYLSDNMNMIDGAYTYTAMDAAGNTSVAFTDYLTIEELPVFDTDSINIQANGTMPTITWAPVDSSLVDQYRIQIKEGLEEGDIIWTDYTKGTSYIVPPGVLDPDVNYRVRVEGHWGHRGMNRHSRTRSDDVSFKTGSRTGTPYIDAIDWGRGVKTWNNERDDAYLNFYIHVYDAQGVPENIESVQVTFPDGTMRPLFYDEPVNDYAGEYITDYHRSAPSGTYEFLVRDKDGHTWTTTQEFSPDPIDSIPKSNLSPGHNYLADEDAVTFQWSPVNRAAFYEIKIMDQDQNGLFWFRVPGDDSTDLTVSSSIMKRGELYKYAVRAVDDFGENNPRNWSQSDWSSLSYDLMTERLPGTNAPRIDLDNFGVALLHVNKSDGSGTRYELEFWVRVRDVDGVPGNIKQTWVELPNGERRDLYFDETESDTAGYYFFLESFEKSEDVPQGKYIFKVEDAQGNLAVIEDELVVAPIDVPQNVQPLDGAILPIEAAVIGWNAVSEAEKYRVRLYDRWESAWIHQSPLLDEPGYLAPADVLEDGGRYRFRVQAYREDPAVSEVDNMSLNHFRWGAMPYFQVSGEILTEEYTVSLDPGDRAADYRMVAAPLLDERGVWADIVGKAPEEYDRVSERIGIWNQDLEDYLEYPDMCHEIVLPGSVAWMLFRNGKDLTYKGYKTPTLLDPVNQLPAWVLPIFQGWNMVGNPFTFSIETEGIVVQDENGSAYRLKDEANDITGRTFYVYDGNEEETPSYLSASVLETAEGGWIKKLTPGTGIIYFPAAEAGQAALATPRSSLEAGEEEPPPPPGGLQSSGGYGLKEGGGGAGCFIITTAE